MGCQGQETTSNSKNDQNDLLIDFDPIFEDIPSYVQTSDLGDGEILSDVIVEESGDTINAYFYRDGPIPCWIEGDIEISFDSLYLLYDTFCDQDEEPVEEVAQMKLKYKIKKTEKTKDLKFGWKQMDFTEN